MTPDNSSNVVLFFDDQPAREGRYVDLLRRGTGFDVEFVGLKDKMALAELEVVAKTHPKCDLVLLDHRLNESAVGTPQSVRAGSTLAPHIREIWPGCPIIGVTAAPNEPDDIARVGYDAVFALNQMSRLAPYIPHIVNGYRQIERHGLDLDGLLSLFRCPDREREALGSSMPRKLKGAVGTTPLPHLVFRWFREQFYREPGFVFDRDWTAVLVGVKTDCLSRFEPSLEPAKYSGVFSDTEDPRWWKASLYDVVLPASQKRFFITLQEAACEKFNTTTDEWSICHRCGDRWPEILACQDEGIADKQVMVPMHLRCTRAHKYSSASPYYEELRVMLEE